MDRFIKKVSKYFQYGQKGFTLIELLIVIAVLGILAAIAIPSVTGFILTGNVGAANSEVAAVKTAVQAYMADYPTADKTVSYTANTSDTGVPALATVGYSTDMSGSPLKADYTYDISLGTVTKVVDSTTAWPSGMQFSISSQTWIKSSATPATGTRDVT